MVANFRKHILKFNFNAGTSRGILKEKNTWYIFLEHHGILGIGEAGPLAKLSVDDVPEFESVLEGICNDIHHIKSYDEIASSILPDYPSIIFGIQTAWKDLENGGQKLIFKNAFFERETPIPINGLVWMNDAESMIKQAEAKLKDGYTCIKFKVGALDFDEELYVIKTIRERSSSISIRLDANGAWDFDEAKEKMTLLRSFGIHSIEQPIKPKQYALMRSLTQKRIIDIALDEELI